MSGKLDIEKFLAIGYGSGAGPGDGYGDGYAGGDGYGSGYGSGYGAGYGFGNTAGGGSGNGSGHGGGICGDDGADDGRGGDAGYRFGVKSFNGQVVHYIDDVPTIIRHVVGFYAKGFILHDDLTLQATFVARSGNCFAHGLTLHEAQAEASRKDMEQRPLEERIEAFKAEHPDIDAEYDGEDLFAWHGTLTGSCKQGRLAWCRDHQLDPATVRMTVRRFCKLTRNAYGGEAIRQLERMYGIKEG